MADPCDPVSPPIPGVICGYRVEDIEDPLMQQIRYLDKLVDEPACPAATVCTHLSLRGSPRSTAIVTPEA